MLDFEFWNIFWAVFNVILLFVLLKIFLFKPIGKMLDDRTQSIQKDIDDAERAKREAEELKAQYEISVSEAKEEAGRILRAAYDEAETERENILRRSHEEAENIVNAAGESIENERKRVIRQAHTEIADLAIEAASKVIGENLDDEKNRRLVDEFLTKEEVGKK